MRRVVSILLFLYFTLSVFAFPPKYEISAADALRMLDREVTNSGKYELMRLRYIDSLKLAPVSSAINYYNIAEAYRKFNIDSALANYLRAESLARTANDDSIMLTARLRYISLLPAAGHFYEAERIFDSIRPEDVPIQLRSDYYKAGNQLYFYVSSSINDARLANTFARKASVMTDSLMKYLEPGTIDYLFYDAERNMLQGNRSIALADISEILSNADAVSYTHGRAHET